MFVPKDPRAALCRPWVGTSYTVAQVSSSLSVAGHAPAAEAAEVVAGGDAPSVPGSPRSASAWHRDSASGGEGTEPAGAAAVGTAAPMPCDVYV